MGWMPKRKRFVEWMVAGTLALTGVLAANGMFAPEVHVLAQSSASSPVPTTQLTDTVYRADGTAASGTVLVSWPAFTTSNGLEVPEGSTSVTLGAGGQLSLALAPNAGSSPMGSYYTAIYHLDDGTVSREYWVVPASQYPVSISAIKSTVLPASVAMQTVTKNYVDTAITAAVTGHPLATSTPYVLKTGDTMTGPLVLPGDPTTATQAADKNYVDENVSAIGAGVGQKVALNPLATQVVVQPAGTQLSVNRQNGTEYASQYASGVGNNGIANAVTSADCANGCDVRVDAGYASGELPQFSQVPSETHIEDDRHGSRWDRYLDPENSYHAGTEVGQTIDVISTRNGAALKQLGGTNTPQSFGVQISHEGLSGGQNIFPQTIEGTVPYFKSAYSALLVNGVYNAQGQHVLNPQGVSCYGVGDCLIGAETITSSGGFRDEADEGAHPMDLQFREDPIVFDGVCNTGCTTGSTSLTLNTVTGTGTEGEGRFLIDMNPAKTITTGQLVGGALSSPHAVANFAGTSFPVSTFFATGQIIPSQANNLAPGTVTFQIATSGVAAGYATNTAAAPAPTGVACVADQPNGFNPANYEMANYTVVDGTHLQMTFNKVHNVNATIAIGGLCGYGLEQTVDTTAGIRQVWPVIGSYSPTALYYASTTATATVGQVFATSAYLNINLGIASMVRSNNVVTVTLTSSMPKDLNGLNMTIAGAADSSYNGTFPVTTTSKQTITYAQTGPNSSTTGGTVSYLTGGYVLYPMAEALNVMNPVSKIVDGTMTLAPNTVPWAAGDAVEQPHFYQQRVAPDTTYVTQIMPRSNTYVGAGIDYQGNNGPGLQGFTINNATPASSYYGNGGTHAAPDFAYQAQGVWQRTMRLQAGEQSVFTIGCNSHGCGNWNSQYNLFELQSSASTDLIQWNPAASDLGILVRGAGYFFTPQAFSATTANLTTVNATTINATTLNGKLSGSNITSGTVAGSLLGTFGASGASHSTGAVPDPGATAGNTRYLREDGTWSTPAGSGGTATVAQIQSGTIDSTVIGGTTPAAGTFSTLSAKTAMAPSSGGTGSAATPAAGQLLVGNAAGTAYAPQTLSGDCTVSSSGAIVCTKTNGVALGSAATTSASAYDAAGTAASLTTPAALVNELAYSYGLEGYGDSKQCSTGTSTTTIGNVVTTAQQHGQFWSLQPVFGGEFNTYCEPGDTSVDMSKWEFTHLYNYGPGGPNYVLEIGTNDVNNANGATTGYQNSFQYIEQGAQLYAAIPIANKTLAQGTGVTTTGTWSPETAYYAGWGQSSTTNGSEINMPVTVNADGHIVVWTEAFDSNGGTFTISVDGGAPLADPVTSSTTFTATGYGGTAMLSSKGNKSPWFGYVFGGFTAGAHTVHVTVTSATSASNIVEVGGVAGIPAASTAAGNPYVFVSGVEYQNLGNDTLTATYNSIVSNVTSTLAGYGLNVKFEDTRNALLNSPLCGNGNETTMFANCYADTLHQNNTGASVIAATYTATATAINPALTAGALKDPRKGPTNAYHFDASPADPTHWWTPNGAGANGSVVNGIKLGSANGGQNTVGYGSVGGYVATLMGGSTYQLMNCNTTGCGSDIRNYKNFMMATNNGVVCFFAPSASGNCGGAPLYITSGGVTFNGSVAGSVRFSAASNAGFNTTVTRNTTSPNATTNNWPGVSGNIPAVYGTNTAGHAAVFYDAAGDLVDGGPVAVSTAATVAAGSGVSSATAATATLTNLRGTVVIAGGTATTGTIATLSWAATPTAYVCTATQNGGSANYLIGNSVATTTGFSITAGASVAGATVTVNYSCQQ